MQLISFWKEKSVTMKKVSVIVPVYNVENYLRKCLDSLVNQTLTDIEVIIVNDGSKDNSQIIIDEYVNQSPNLMKSFIKKNRRIKFSKKLWIRIY